MSYSFLRGLGVMDPPASILNATEEEAERKSDFHFTPGQPPPSWKRRNELTEYKKNLSRRGAFSEGEGEEKYADGSVYKGQRKAGKRHDNGCFWWPDRGLYVGRFFEGFMHGLGEFRYPAGGKYNGELKLGKRCGLGGYLYSRHDTEPFAEFLGQWDDDQPNGWGLRLSKDGSVYLGMLSGGQRHGPGVFVSKKNESKRRGGAGGGGGGTSSNVLTFLRVIIKDGEWAADEYTGATVSLQENVGNFQEDLASGEEQLQELTEEEKLAAMERAEENLQKKLAEQSAGKSDVTIVELLDILRSGPLKTITSKVLVKNIDQVLDMLSRARGLVDLSSRQTTKIYAHYADRVLGF